MTQQNAGTRTLTRLPIGLGCMGMSGVYGATDDAESIATMKKWNPMPAIATGMRTRGIHRPMAAMMIEPALAWSLLTNSSKACPAS